MPGLDECSSLLNKSTHEATEEIDPQVTPPVITSFERATANKDVVVEEVTAEGVSIEDKQTSCKEVAKTYKELDPERINIRFTIGEGEFGKVCAGAFAEYTLVAVKMLHPDVPEKTQQDFLKEADTMQQLSHPNIIKLVGVVTRKEPRMIVTEFMHHGSLDKYLQGVGKSVKCCGLLRMLIDVCEGMKYLSGLGYVHRKAENSQFQDLAARNILIDEKRTCKISDFGLARKIGEKLVDDAYTLTGGKVPIRWTAPEAVIYRRFTIASDVWSFGIVSWEVFSYGQRPYWDWTNQTVISMLERGYRLPCPEACPKEMHCLMLNCWSAKTEKRPNFDTLGVYLEKILEDEEPLVSSLPNGEPHSGSTSFSQPTFILPTAEAFTNLQITSKHGTKMRTELPTKTFQRGQNTDDRNCTTRVHYEGSKLKHSCNVQESIISQNGTYYNVPQNKNGLEPA
ncbi:protein tyrosine kinase, partial [Opisthorchis viverrini]